MPLCLAQLPHAARTCTCSSSLQLEHTLLAFVCLQKAKSSPAFAPCILLATSRLAD
jgi:hypothetical protein